MVLNVASHRRSVFQQVLAQGDDKRVELGVESLVRLVGSLMGPEGGVVLVPATSEVAPDVADTAVLLVAVRIVQSLRAGDARLDIKVMDHGGSSSCPLGRDRSEFAPEDATKRHSDYVHCGASRLSVFCCWVYSCCQSKMPMTASEMSMISK